MEAPRMAGRRDGETVDNAALVHRRAENALTTSDELASLQRDAEQGVDSVPDQRP